MPPSPNNQKRRSKLPSLIVTLVLLAIGFWAYSSRYAIYDWALLYDYQAPAKISQLADQTTMTDYGRKLFYINKPMVDGREKFNQECPNNGGEQTIVLGCYHGGQRGIFLFDVQDARLNGVVQVTAAHEMLHSGYERLKPEERRSIDRLLQNYYDTQLKDDRIKKVMEAYTRSEPNELNNEMHSIFGTEIGTLPAPLETYYKRYFNNRQQVTKYATQYQAEFSSRQAAIASYDQQLAVLKTQIDDTEALLKSEQTTITGRQNQLVALRGSDTAAYNAAVPGYNQLIDTYNNRIETARRLISDYNQIVAARNAVAVEQDELVKELSSTPQPISN